MQFFIVYCNIILQYFLIFFAFVLRLFFLCCFLLIYFRNTFYFLSTRLCLNFFILFLLCFISAFFIYCCMQAVVKFKFSLSTRLIKLSYKCFMPLANNLLN